MFFGDDIFETKSADKEQLTADFMEDEKAIFDPNENKPNPPKQETKPPVPAKKGPKQQDRQKPCDPYQLGYYDYESPLSLDIAFRSLVSDCEMLNPSPVSALKEGLPFDLLQDKTAVLIGDSVDRQNLDLLCNYINGNITISEQDSHEKPAPGTSGGYPHLCYVEKYNLSISNYFFYGFDQESLFKDKEMVFLEPGDYLDRISLAQSAIKSLKRKVDIAFINVGFWELARIDRLDSNKNKPEAVALRRDFVNEYQTKLSDFINRIANILPNSRLVYRETHYPMFETGPFFSTSDTINRKHKFNKFKVHQINQVARLLAESSSIGFWPIGSHVRDIPFGEYMVDDRKYLSVSTYFANSLVHPKISGAVALWGNSMLDYIARS